MKVHGTIIGLAALLAAGSANASVVYDTITGQTAANTNLLTTSSGFHAPLGSDFTTSYVETINSVQVALYVPGGTSSTHQSDTGSVLVYLVQGTGTGPTSLPSATGVKLNSPTLLGSISDSSLLGGNVANDITLSTNITIGAGTWWIELTSASDPNNYYGDINPTASVAKWGEILATATGTTGVPTGGWYTSGTNFANTSIIGGVSNHSTNPSNPSPNDEIFMMTVNATVPTPEPASLTMLGVGLVGLGFKRYRRNK